jgi:hypothetical protein
MYFVLNINVRMLFLSTFSWDLLLLKEYMLWLLAREAKSSVTFSLYPSKSLSDPIVI